MAVSALSALTAYGVRFLCTAYYVALLTQSNHQKLFKTRFVDNTWNHSPSGENARVAEPLMHN